MEISSRVFPFPPLYLYMEISRRVSPVLTSVILIPCSETVTETRVSFLFCFFACKEPYKSQKSIFWNFPYLKGVCCEIFWLLSFWPLTVVTRYLKYWEFAHSLIAHSLRSLRSNEWLWTICSDCSGKMSGCEQIAQVTHDKWATVSDSLRSLMIL